MAEFYTYMHTRNDTGRPFYIGKGSGDRAWHRSKKRGAHWNNIVRKHGFSAVVLASWETEEAAFEHERLLIAAMRDIGAPLINRTDGGEGKSGATVSNETRAKLSSIKRGVVNGEMNPMFGRRHSEDARRKQSEAKRGTYTGSRHPKATITEEKAVSILSARGSMTAKDASQKFGASFHVVRNIWSGKSWRFVNG